MASLGPVSRPSVPDQVFTRLCDLIITGQYEPGERLPTQRALASDFGVNMASVREAIKRLEQLRLVEVRHGDATRVLDWRRTGLEALTLLGVVDESVVRPLFEARRLVLAQVARLAAERRSDEQAAQVAEAVAGVAAAPDDDTAVRAALTALTREGYVEAELDQIGDMEGEPDEEPHLSAWQGALEGEVSIVMVKEPG